MASLHYADQWLEVWQGDNRAAMAQMPEQSVHAVVTSPPYYGLRSYGTGAWDGGDPACEHERQASGRGTNVPQSKNPGVDYPIGPHRGGNPDECVSCGAVRVEPTIWGGDREHAHEWGPQIPGSSRGGSGTPTDKNNRGEGYGRGEPRGNYCECGAWRGALGLEPTPEAYIEHLVEVFREVRRVLRDDGLLWLNLGDTYANDTKWGGTTGGKHATALHGDPSIGRERRYTGLKGKDLIGIPWMAAFALRADGWYLRQDIVWNKPNAMPESVEDRPSRSHEFIFMLAKQPRYFYDHLAVKEPASEATVKAVLSRMKDPVEDREYQHDSETRMGKRSPNRVWSDPEAMKRLLAGRNLRDVWSIPTVSYPGAHYACVDDQTEALTPTGWKSQEDLSDGDWIAAYVDGVIEWQSATFHRFDYDGDLVRIEKRHSSQRLTPNHRCLVLRRSGARAVVEASRLVPSMRLPMAAPWRIPTRSPIGVQMAALLGWYIAEGHSVSAGRVDIYQSQSANASHVDTIRFLLTTVGADFAEKTRTRGWRGRDSVEVVFRVKGVIAKQLQDLAPSKKMDPSLVSLPGDEAQALLNALVGGDGHTREDGRQVIIQKDRQSIDAMQMLALRLGYRASISAHGTCLALNLAVGQWLTLRGANGTHLPVGTERYSGTVWCPSVAAGFWLARRSGKPFITGNTFPPRLVEPMLKASTSEGGVCATCGQPFLRETVEVGVTTAKGGEPHAPEYGARMHGMDDLNGTGETGSGFSMAITETLGWVAPCGHEGESVPATILDPFGGSGTVAKVAQLFSRRAILIDLNAEYIEQQMLRNAQVALGL